jgi:membrane-associated phospholipid phosphatase
MAGAPTSRQLAAYIGSCLAVLVIAYLLLDGTVAGQAWSDQAYLGSALQPVHASRSVNWALQWITPLSVALVCGVLIAVGTVRHRPMVGVTAALGLGLAVVLAEVLRTVLPHPDLATGFESLMGGKVYQTFPSGHATIATAATLGLLLVVPRSWHTPVAVLGTLATALVAAGTVAAHWHRPADPVGGIALAGAIQATCAWILVRRYDSRADGPGAQGGRRWALPVGCLVAAVLAIAFLLSDVRLARVSMLPAGVHPGAFPSAIVLIVLASAVGISAYARLLRGVDLCRTTSIGRIGE